MTEIAIVGSQPLAVNRVRRCVEARGHTATLFSTAGALRFTARRSLLGMIVFAVDAEEESPAACIRAARIAVGPNIPILVATDQAGIESEEAWFESPLNEFIVKPYTPKELSARIHASLLRAGFYSQKAEQVFGPYRFLSQELAVELRGSPIKLTPKLFNLALFFFRHSGLLITRADLQAAIWPRGGDGLSRTIDTHISIVRRRLKMNAANGYVLRAVYGSGYRLEDVLPEAHGAPQADAASAGGSPAGAG